MASMAESYGSDLHSRPQSCRALGHRMAAAFSDAFSRGAERVVIIGTDCPEITSLLIWRFFESLANADMVIGPATDGGYYLIGIRRFVHDLLTDIPLG